MVSDCPTSIPALTQDCRALIHFANEPGASLEMNLSPMLAKMARSKTQGSSSGSLSRGGVATPDCKARSPVLSEGCPWQAGSADSAGNSWLDLLLLLPQEHTHRDSAHHSIFH